MSLPYPADRPLIPFQMYAPTDPPVLFDIRSETLTGSFAANVTAFLCNEICNRAYNGPARMFCYNRASQNNWNNPYFRGIVQFTCDLTSYKLGRNQIRTEDDGVFDTVTEVMGYYTSDLVFEYPELKEMIDQIALNAAHQNSTTFNQIKQELTKMNHHYPGHAHPGQAFDAYGRPIHPVAHAPQMVTIQTPQGPMLVDASQLQAHQYPAHHGHRHHTPHPSYPVHQSHGGPQYGHRDMGGYGNWQSEAPRVVSPTEAARDERFAGRRHDTPTTTRAAPAHVRGVEVINPRLAQEAPKPNAKIPVLSFEDGTEMDRKQHTIRYFGWAEVTNERQFDRLEKAADRLQTQTLSGSNTRKEAGDLENVQLDPAVGLASNLDTVVQTGRANQMTYQRDTLYRNVFRHFSIIGNIHCSPVTLEEAVDMVFQVTSFDKVVELMESAAMQADTIFKGQKSEELLNPTTQDTPGEFNTVGKQDPEEHQKIRLDNTAHSMIAFMSFIDRLLTKLTNDFLTNRLRSSGKPVTAVIDSFYEDIKGLRKHLEDHYGISYAKAFDAFEKDVMATVFMARNTDWDSVIRENGPDLVDNYDFPEGVHRIVVPTAVSVTYLCMDAKQLGLDLKAGPAMIDPASAPTLYKLCRSLVAHQRDHNLVTNEDILVTSDDVRYRVYTSYLDGRVYYIQPL